MAALEDGLDLREARRRSMDALDLAPAQHKETMQAARSPSAPLSPQPVAPAAVQPSLDDRHLTCRRSKLARPRRQAKPRRYEGAVAKRDAKNDFAEFETPRRGTSARLEIRLQSHAHAAAAASTPPASTPPTGAPRSRDWGSSSKKGGKSRKSASTPPMPLERVVVLDEVGASDAPVCGIDLGPFLSWLNCMPAIPEERTEEDEYNPKAGSWQAWGSNAATDKSGPP